MRADSPRIEIFEREACWYVLKKTERFSWNLRAHKNQAPSERTLFVLISYARSAPGFRSKCTRDAFSGSHVHVAFEWWWDQRFNRGGSS